MVNAQPLVFIPASGLVIPKGVQTYLRMLGSKRISQAQITQGAKPSPSFWVTQRIPGKSIRVIHIVIRWTHIIIATQN